MSTRRNGESTVASTDKPLIFKHPGGRWAYRGVRPHLLEYYPRKMTDYLRAASRWCNKMNSRKKETP